MLMAGFAKGCGMTRHTCIIIFIASFIFLAFPQFIFGEGTPSNPEATRAKRLARPDEPKPAEAIAQTPPPPTAEERARIEELIKQLGDEDFAKREAAEKALIDFGDKALLQVEKAKAESSDPEIRHRCDNASFMLKWHISYDLSQKLGNIRPLFDHPHEYNNERNLMERRVAEMEGDDALAFASRLLEATYSRELFAVDRDLFPYVARHGLKAFELVRQWKNPMKVYLFIRGHMDVQNDLELDKAILDYLSKLEYANRQRYMDLLGSMQEDQKKLMPIYLLALDSNIQDVRDWAVYSVSGIMYCDFGYDPKSTVEAQRVAIGEMKKWWEENKNKPEQELIRHAAICDVNSTGKRIWAIRKLAQAKDASLNEQLHKYLDEKEMGLGWCTVNTLFVLGDNIGVEKCRAALKSGNEKEISGMLPCCPDILKDKSLQDQLVEAFKDSSLAASVRGDLFSPIEKNRRPELLSTLEGIVNDKMGDIGLRGNALSHIYEINAEEGEKLAVGVLDDKDDNWNVHCSAIGVMIKVGGKRHLGKVAPYLDSDNEILRYNALIAVYLLAAGDASICDVGFEEFAEKEQAYIAHAKELAKKAMENDGGDENSPSTK